MSLFDAVVTGRADPVPGLVREALAAGVAPEALVAETLIPAMDEVGRRYEAGESFVPELLVSARAMKAALAILSPLLAAKGAEPAGRVVIGTVSGDLHDIGKNLVAASLEGGGFEVADLGADVAPERFVAAVRETGATVVALSALLTTTMVHMRETVEAIEAAGIRDRVTILVGGAPLTAELAAEIGADGFGTSGAAAVALARRATAG